VGGGDGVARWSKAHFGETISYDRTLIPPGILHLGIEAFHRAHMAAYVDTILATQNDWGIVGASLRRPDTKALAKQDFLYTLATRDATSTRTRLIGSVLGILDANTQRAKLLAMLADPRIRIVSLSITEKGYCRDPSTGDLDESHPDIVHDLARPDEPVSGPGVVVHGLMARWRAGIPPFTVLSCDNLMADGTTTARVVSQFASHLSLELAKHISRDVAFPSSMVDRIVPPTTDADRKIVRDLTNVDDAWPVMTEPFSQWVLEDRFPNGRPAFERAGVQMVDRVAPFERMKLRILNGAHSALAYLGYLAGHEYVSDVMRSPTFVAFIRALITEEIMPTLDIPGRDRILDRFANPVLRSAITTGFA
jgi:fructuronate reductase